MKMTEFAKSILLGQELEDKLIDVNKIEFDDNEPAFVIPKLPARSNKISFSAEQTRFPKGHFHLAEKKAIALHSFANHELLAIEMMACALLIYPHNTPELKKFKRGIISALKDEQLHFKLYLERLNEIGFDYGDFSINDFFWSKMQMLKTPSEYLAVMSLTFEAANLDFAHYYKHLFTQLGDFKTSDILDKVLRDEISHVNLGVNYLNKWKGDASLWDYYNECLPWPLTPARAKGKNFVLEVRRKAKMDEDFITRVREYKDDFGVTMRKEWTK